MGSDSCIESEKKVLSQLNLLRRVVLTLWRSGILRMSPTSIVPIIRAWWRCRSSFAFLGEMAAIRFPSQVAIQDEEGSLSFAELQEQVQAWARFLSHRHKIGPGSQVALACGNHRGFVLGLLSLTRIGADVLPLGTDLPGAVLAKILERQKISLILHEPQLAVTLKAWAPNQTNLSVDSVEPLVSGPLAAVSRPGQLVTLTSGSTGISKGIRRRPTLFQVLPALAGLLESLPFELYRPFVLAIPLYHGYGVATLAVSLSLGAPLHMATRFEISPLLDGIDSQECPILVTVPTLLLRWLRSSTNNYPRLGAIVSGSAPLDGKLSSEVLDAVGPVLFNLYGSSEAGLISLAPPDALKEAPGTVGWPLPGNSFRLMNSENEAVSVGQTGRIVVRGPLVLGTNEQGWRDTGDLGRVDEAGRLFVCGRADSMMVTGGENVFPHEVEEALLSHPEVLEVAIIVVKDAEFAQAMWAALVLQPHSQIDAPQLREWLRQRVERFKLPRRICVLDAIPRNALGKVDRKALERILLQDTP